MKKKLFTIVATFALTFSLFAATRVMNVNLKDGNVHTYIVDDVETVTYDTLPAKIIYPDEFYTRLNDNTPNTLNTGDTIKANTLLVDGVNSDYISVDVVLRNNVLVDPEAIRFTVSNSFLGKVNVSNNFWINDSIFSVTFPAIEGNYSLSVNNKTRSFNVVGTGKELSKQGRSHSNTYTAIFNDKVSSNLGITFVPYDKVEDRGARLTATGSFITLDEEQYNLFLNATSISTVADFIEDAKPEDGKLMLRDVKYFIYIANSKNYVVKITNFAGSDVETSDLEMVVTF